MSRWQATVVDAAEGGPGALGQLAAGIHRETLVAALSGEVGAPRRVSVMLPESLIRSREVREGLRANRVGLAQRHVAIESLG